MPNHISELGPEKYLLATPSVLSASVATMHCLSEGFNTESGQSQTYCIASSTLLGLLVICWPAWQTKLDWKTFLSVYAMWLVRTRSADSTLSILVCSDWRAMWKYTQLRPIYVTNKATAVKQTERHPMPAYATHATVPFRHGIHTSFLVNMAIWLGAPVLHLQCDSM